MGVKIKTPSCYGSKSFFNLLLRCPSKCFGRKMSVNFDNIEEIPSIILLFLFFLLVKFYPIGLVLYVQPNNAHVESN